MPLRHFGRVTAQNHRRDFLGKLSTLRTVTTCWFSLRFTVSAEQCFSIKKKKQLNKKPEHAHTHTYAHTHDHKRQGQYKVSHPAKKKEVW